MTATEGGGRLRAVAARLRARSGVDRVTFAVVAVVVAAFAARFYRLGARTAHFDEGRVAYWVLDYAASGNFRYRPIIHGPFLQHVNEVIFGVLGPTDFAMRVVVAVVTGLFPLAALLLRERLRDIEVVVLAAFWAFTPVVLYYSRFMRGDPLVAAFMVTAFALFVRTADTGRRRYFYAGVGFVALGFSAKENALLYLLCWVGGAALLLDHRLFRAADRGEDWTAVATAHGRRALRVGWRHANALLFGALCFLAVVGFFYAPRGETAVGPGLGAALSDPSLLPAALREATVGSVTALADTWVNSPHQDHAYLPYLGHFLATLRAGGFAVCVLAVAGFVADRYRSDGPSDLVAIAFYWGVVSVLGYPIATDIKAPWATVHAVVPLAIPAAVGLGLFVRWGRDALGDDDRVSAGLAALVLAVVVAQVAVAGAGQVYQTDHREGNQLVQYAQPAPGVQPVMRDVGTAATDHAGTDVVLYGDYFVDAPGATGPRRPACSPWQQVLPLPWYFERADATASCVDSAEALTRTVERARPLVVVARADDVSDRPAALSGYERRTRLFRDRDTRTHFFLRGDLANATAGG
ncbi:membrane-bound mannosyltransferase [Halosimplex carlsbadense 2-9-1]|uniref:Membrane-bound mannosyltransferase n=1 Tax=Halosimplex carlsbadense 2-9-1 TaxID=797114 RepID=M0CKY2_9EURY|nr:flippase activity-associated protein Agl23 [Halosimplex carlsbadense]ELZ22519.1 membrane-bound mannosyltransferase [Halosimplex carlsbadense 2-9-1]